jgi:hypothetical protein
VLNPEQANDLYFVATGHGGHVFSATIEGQAKNVAAYRAFERQQQGLPESREIPSTPIGDTNVTVLDPSMPRLPPVPAKKKRAAHHR